MIVSLFSLCRHALDSATHLHERGDGSRPFHAQKEEFCCVLVNAVRGRDHERPRIHADRGRPWSEGGACGRGRGAGRGRGGGGVA